MSNWEVYPENWMEQGNRCMISYIEGLENQGWAIECSSFNPDPLFGRPEWEAEYEAGYRYYVLKYEDPVSSQRALAHRDIISF